MEMSAPGLMKGLGPLLFAQKGNPQAEKVVKAMLAHAEHCRKTDLTLVELKAIVAEQQKTIAEQVDEEAAMAHLEQSLEDCRGELDESRRSASALERDTNEVERRLACAEGARREAMALVRALKESLALAERSEASLKRRLAGLGANVTNGFGVGGLAFGLQLRALDVVACQVCVANGTNMDVSLAGWTLRVVNQESLRTVVSHSLGTDANVTVAVSSPTGGGGGGRRDSLVRRRHAYYFGFDFMLAAGSECTVHWGPEVGSYEDGNHLHWQRPEDFGASDVVHVTEEDRLGNEDEDAGQGGHARGTGGQWAAAARATAGGAAAYGRAGASLARWEEGGGGGEDDPDVALKHGALCLVDPNGCVTHTLPLLAQDCAQHNGGPHPDPNTHQQAPDRRAAAAAAGGGGHQGLATGSAAFGFAAARSPVPVFGSGMKPLPQSALTPMNNSWNNASNAGATPGDHLWAMAAPLAAGALATPRRLGERFAAALRASPLTDRQPASRPWGDSSRRRRTPAALATPLPEPSVPDSCAVM